MTSIPITPVAVFPTQATTLQIQGVNVDLNNIASYNWALLDAAGNQLLSGNGSLTSAQYNGWGTSDNYVINCILTNLGLTANPPVTD